MVIFLLKITPFPHQRQEILDILRCLQAPTAIQWGCQNCEIYEGVGEEPTILYMELWDSLDAVQRHVRSAAYTRILSTIEMSAKKPEIHFYEIAQSWGLDLVETLRSHEEPGQNTG